MNNILDISNLSDFLYNSINKSKIIQDSLNTIGGSCNNEFYIVGGFIRDSILGQGLGHDIDIMVENGDERIHKYLDRIEIPYSLNRHGIRQYNMNGILFDIYEPSQFQIGFNSILECLKFYDLRINAVGYKYNTNLILNPLNGIEYINKSRVGLNLKRWDSDLVPFYERCILVVRLIKILEKYKHLFLTNDELKKVFYILDRISPELWTKLNYRYEGSFKNFIGSANQVLRTRISVFQ